MHQRMYKLIFQLQKVEFYFPILIQIEPNAMNNFKVVLNIGKHLQEKIITNIC